MTQELVMRYWAQAVLYWWAWLIGGLVLGFMVGVWTTGRVMVQLYAERITFLEYQLAKRHVDVEASMR